MKIVEISESKIEKMSECVEDMLLMGGKLMQCLEEIGGEGYGERNTYGMRGGSMGYREDDDYPVMSRYGERGRRRNRYGRYV